MIFAEDFQPDRQRFVEKLQRVCIVALTTIHPADIVVTIGGMGMIFAEDFQGNHQRFVVKLQRFGIVALLIILCCLCCILFCVCLGSLCMEGQSQCADQSGSDQDFF